jgi:uncharacterized alpha-E superfamily protein
MLSRTAEQLYWMARHIERAENTARMLDVTYRMRLLPASMNQPIEPWAQAWAVPLITTGLASAYYASYTDLTAENVLEFLVSNPDNPSSIVNCLRSARENARSVRGAITSEMWESLNSTWMEFGSIESAVLAPDLVGDYFEQIKQRSHMFRGVTVGTALRDESFFFTRLGTFLERADNTARILDVKYHILLPSPMDVGGAQDYYQWGSLLRSVSAFEAYRKIYRDTIHPGKVAELLLLRKDMPRSLRNCASEIYSMLQTLAGTTGKEAERQAGELNARLAYARMDDVMEEGLHEYLLDFLRRTAELGAEIHRSFFASLQTEARLA